METLYTRKLIAWLALPWDDALSPTPAARTAWQSHCYSKLNLVPTDEDHALLTTLNTWLADWEGLPIESAPLPPQTAPILLHPLSAAPIPTAPPAEPDAVRAQCLATFDSLISAATADPRTAFLNLWRHAPDAAPQLPARADYPYFTVPERQAVASALATAYPRPALLSFRIGGVQEFIDQARTTEDFWARSYLISHLSWIAVRVLADRFGPDSLIFPLLSGRLLVDRWLKETQGLTGLDVRESGHFRHGEFPNGLLAIVPEPSAKDAAEACVTAFKQEWSAIVRSSFKLLLSHFPGLDRFKEDAKAFSFELFWAFEPWREGLSYRHLYREVSARIEARKTLRDFPASNEPNIKCARCGQREALQSHPALEYDRDASNELWNDLSTAGGKLKHRFRPAEKLCAVCATCRLAGRAHFYDSDENETYPSLSSIAVTPFLAQLIKASATNSELAPVLGYFKDALRELFTALDLRPLSRTPYCLLTPPTSAPWDFLLRIDGDWFFPETYRPESLQREYGEATPAPDFPVKRAAAARALTDLRTAYKKLKIQHPAKYCVLIAADGDNVGNWISGSELPYFSQLRHPALLSAPAPKRDGAGILSHTILSSRLSRIGEAIQNIVEGEMMGRLIYSGGDDFLAIVPVDPLLPGLEHCAAQIANPDLMGPAFTISAVAMVMPHADSLSGAIQEARELLKREAKARLEKRCCVIAARRTSGARSLAPVKWRYRDHSGIADLELLARAFSSTSNALSGQSVTQFGFLVPGLAEFGARNAPQVASLALHLLGDSSKSQMESIRQAAHRLAAWSFENPSLPKVSGADNLLEILLMARFLSRLQIQTAAAPEPTL